VPTSLTGSATPPSPAPPAPPPPAMSTALVAPSSASAGPSISAPPGDRSALLGAIQGGLKLKKTVTNDRSAAPVSGQVLGDNAPPPHINTAPRPPSPPVSLNQPPSAMLQGENFSSSSKRQSVDWYAGLAADQGVVHPPLPATAEEDEHEHDLTTLVPHIHVSEPAEASEKAVDDPMDDIDKSIGK
jgi:hypothetical protein